MVTCDFTKCEVFCAENVISICYFLPWNKYGVAIRSFFTFDGILMVFSTISTMPQLWWLKYIEMREE